MLLLLLITLLAIPPLNPGEKEVSKVEVMRIVHL